jgi:hypothetical protein
VSARIFWLVSSLSALVAWAGIFYLTGAFPPTPPAELVFLALVAVAVAMTSAPLVWVLARRLKVAGTGERPALALRVGAWIGLWAAICVGLRLVGSLNAVIALTLAVILALLEAFLRQLETR